MLADRIAHAIKKRLRAQSVSVLRAGEIKFAIQNSSICVDVEVEGLGVQFLFQLFTKERSKLNLDSFSWIWTASSADQPSRVI